MVSRMSDTDAAEEVSPSAPEADTFELPETPDSLALDYIQQAIMPADEADEPEPQADLDLDDEEEQDDEDVEDEEPYADELPEDVDDTEPATEPQGKSVDEWVEVLSKDGIQRFSEVPRKLLKDVLPQYVERERKQVVEDAATIAQAQLQAQAEWIKWTIKVDKQFEDDPDAMLDWLKSGSQEAQAYQQWKALLDREPTPEDRARAEESQNLNRLMQKQVERLKDYPELQQELAQKHQSNPYRADYEGLERLTDDVMELLRKGVEQSVAKKNEPAKKKAKARVAGAQNRQAVPRPDVSRGRTSKLDDFERRVQETHDPDELAAMAFSRAFNKR